MDHRYAGNLGLPVYLLQVYPDGVEKSEVVGSHGRASGVRISHPAQSEMVPELFVAPEIGQVFEEIPIPGDGFPLELQVGHVVADLHGQLVCHAF